MISQLHQRRILAAVLVVTASCLVGCHRTYQVVLENHMAEPVVAYVHGEELPMRACSVRGTSVLGPPYRSPWHIIARDAAGAEVYRAQFKAANSTQASMIVVIPPRGPEACPTPVASFTLHIWNHSSEAVELYYDGILVATVRPKGDAASGSLVGDWKVPHDLVLRYASGEERKWTSLVGAFVDYDLGQAPEIEIGIN